MKKLLMLILITLLVALCIFVALSGFSIGNIEVLGFTKIQERSAELDAKIQEASKLAEKDYKQAISTVEEDAKKLEREKKEYEDMTVISSEGDVQLANQLERYEIETLWVKLGNHATSEGAIMRMDVVKGTNSVQNVYNLKFTVTGSYISITDFISDIENDSTLGFKIEEFKMVPSGSDSNLQATFVCKDIEIKDVSETSKTEEETQKEKDANNTNSNNTNSNSTNSNSTNSTNTSANTTNTKE